MQVHANQTWRELRLRAEAHESIPTGYKNYAFRDLADELSGSSATKKTPTCVSTTECLMTLKKGKEEKSLGEENSRDDLDLQLE